MRIKKSDVLLLLIVGGAMMVIQPTMVSASNNLLVDASFENWTNSTTLTNWRWVSWGDDNLTQETSTVLSGNSSVKLTKGSGSDGSLRPNQTVIVELNQIYTYSVWVYDNNPNASVRISLETVTTGGYRDSDVSVDNASWQQISATIDSTEGQYASTVISFQDQGATPGGVCYIDAAALI